MFWDFVNASLYSAQFSQMQQGVQFNFMLVDVESAAVYGVGDQGSMSGIFTKIALTDSTDDIKARVQADILAMIQGTYTHIDWNNQTPVDDDDYPFFDPGWLPSWIADLPDDVNDQTVTFVWI